MTTEELNAVADTLSTVYRKRGYILVDDVQSKLDEFGASLVETTQKTVDTKITMRIREKVKPNTIARVNERRNPPLGLWHFFLNIMRHRRKGLRTRSSKIEKRICDQELAAIVQNVV